MGKQALSTRHIHFFSNPKGSFFRPQKGKKQTVFNRAQEKVDSLAFFKEAKN